MNALPRIRRKRNSVSFRRILIERYRMGLYNPDEIWRRYRIDRSLLHRWNCHYQKHFNLIHFPKPMNRYTEKTRKRISELEREVRDLRNAYKEQKLAAEMYRKMIRIAEEEMQIPITKKFGAKQLRKAGGITL